MDKGIYLMQLQRPYKWCWERFQKTYEFYWEKKIGYADHPTTIQVLENFLTENRKELEQRDGQGATGYDYLLYVLVENKCSIEAIKLLLKHGASANHNYYNYIVPPLICITEKEPIDIDMMKFFIENGADVNTPYGMYGTTVLSRVLLFNDKEGKNDHVVEFLLDIGAGLTIYWLLQLYIRGVSDKILNKAPFIPYGSFQLKDGITPTEALSRHVAPLQLVDLIMQKNADLGCIKSLLTLQPTHRLHIILEQELILSSSFHKECNSEEQRAKIQSLVEEEYAKRKSTPSNNPYS